MEHEIKFDDATLKKALHSYVTSLFKDDMVVEITGLNFSRSTLKSVSVVVKG